MERKREEGSGRAGAPERPRVLWTGLGIRPQQVEYRWAREAAEGQRAEARFAALGLVQLLPPKERPTRLVAFCTPTATEQSWPAFERDAKALDLELALERRDLDEAASSKALDAMLRAAAGSVPEGSELLLELGGGPRHFALLAYVASRLLAELRGARLAGAWYAFLESGRAASDAEPRREPNGEPGAERSRKRKGIFFDLKPLLELPAWIEAVRAFQERGDTRPLARLLRAVPGRDQGAVGKLAGLGEAVAWGAPLEAGVCGALLRREEDGKNLARTLGRSRVPGWRELRGKLEETIAETALSTMPSVQVAKGASRVGELKKAVALDRDELLRQARFVEALRRWGRDPQAFMVLREWLVSWVLWNWAADGLEVGDWFDGGRRARGLRGRAEAFLGALTALRDPKRALLDRQPGPIRRLAEFAWRVQTLRNAAMHAGMQKAAVGAEDRDLAEMAKEAWEQWESHYRAAPRLERLRLQGVHDGPVLLAVAGLRPGVLWHAVRFAREASASGAPGPSGLAALVLCSEETESRAREALQRASVPEDKRHLLRVEDADGLDQAELERIVEEARPLLAGAEPLYVCLTGGTTAMQFIVHDRLLAEARSLVRPVRRFAVVDRRPGEEQERCPYEEGARPLWFDEDSERQEEASG